MAAYWLNLWFLGLAFCGRNTGSTLPRLTEEPDDIIRAIVGRSLTLQWSFEPNDFCPSMVCFNQKPPAALHCQFYHTDKINGFDECIPNNTSNPDYIVNISRDNGKFVCTFFSVSLQNSGVWALDVNSEFAQLTDSTELYIYEDTSRQEDQSGQATAVMPTVPLMGLFLLTHALRMTHF